MDILSWIVLGLVAGALGRLIVPGRDSMGWIKTILLGIAGSFVGGLVGNLFTRGDQATLRPSGLVGSIVGAALLVIVFRLLSRKRAV